MTERNAARIDLHQGPGDGVLREGQGLLTLTRAVLTQKGKSAYNHFYRAASLCLLGFAQRSMVTAQHVLETSAIRNARQPYCRCLCRVSVHQHFH
jgi:hypothetical protein